VSSRDRVLDGLREILLAVEHSRHVIAKRFDLNVTDMSALSYLRSRGGLGQTDLATYLELSTSSVTTLIDRLERRGLAARTAHPNDRRRTTVLCTEAGEQIVNEIRDWYSHALDALSEQELAAAASAITTMARELNR
jgi:DNA-binding MarR family transcriptional regulator